MESKSIKDMFGQYISLVFEGKKIPDIQLLEIKRSFYAGVSSSFVYFEELALLPDNEAFPLIDDLEKELNEFWDNECQN